MSILHHLPLKKIKLKKLNSALFSAFSIIIAGFATVKSHFFYESVTNKKKIVMKILNKSLFFPSELIYSFLRGGRRKVFTPSSHLFKPQAPHDLHHVQHRGTFVY